MAARLAAVLASAVSSGGGVPPSPARRTARAEQEPCPFELDGHVGQLPLQPLEVGERAPADDPLGHVAHGVLERPLRRPDAHGGVAAALVVEVAQQDLEGGRVARLPRYQDVVLGDLHRVEGQLGFGGGMDPHARMATGDRDPLAIGRDDDRPDALGPVPSGPAAPDEHPLAPRARGSSSSCRR